MQTSRAAGRDSTEQAILRMSEVLEDAPYALENSSKGGRIVLAASCSKKVVRRPTQSRKTSKSLTIPSGTFPGTPRHH
jgi:hypothetical protein